MYGIFIRVVVSKNLFSGTTGELHAAHSGPRMKNVEPPLEGPGLYREISKAIAGLQLDKSAGIDGVLNKATTKGDYVRQCRHSLMICVYNRIQRLKALGPLAGRLTAKDKVRCAVRSLVNPQVKQEGHPYKKVFKTHKGPDGQELLTLDENGQKIRLENPRWRLILIQGVIDHVTGVVLHKAYTDAAIGLFQERPSADDAQSVKNPT